MSYADTLNAGWNSRDPDTIAGLYAEDGVRHMFAHEETRLEGRKQIAEWVALAMHAWPDCVLTTRNVVEGDGWAVVEWTFSGTQQNDFGPIPGKGQATALKGVSSVNLDSDGLMTEERVYWDGVGLMAGGGLLG